ncbi:uncharacterized protein KY384_000525 [Bacidia gigantensis]|uniref:uncharacterized protein n=1 Tax=Bacidia gigantensis TaxID=2732470 RepID=UPI001D04FD24|nr:uncharacterized protein KY384_000525 [Bacidia gigantensis]KAG8525765.1 hypothetical protein KY384_000525 [Bacidia gigantensis]
MTRQELTMIIAQSVSAFKPLNIIEEEDVESEEEIDDSKELQIEEALKLYQSALKLHSQGPGFFDEAAATYQELFKSEIFTYPEALSESAWLELYGGADADDELEDLPDDLDGVVPSTDGTPSSLPQILYLAHKNYGQFQLDQIRYRLSRIENNLQLLDDSQTNKDINSTAVTGLENLAEALEKDDTDLELWRRVARLSEYLGSRRAARYCLESVVNDGHGPQNTRDSFELEERFAAEQLELLLPKLGETYPESHSQGSVGRRKALAPQLRQQIDPCPYLPSNHLPRLIDQYDHRAKDVKIVVPSQSWTAIGKAILFQMQQESLGDVIVESGAIYRLELPGFSKISSKASPTPVVEGQNAMTQPTPIHQRSPPATMLVDDDHIKAVSPTRVSKDEEDAEVIVSEPPSAGIEGGFNQESATDGTLVQVVPKSPVLIGPVSLPTRKRSSDDAEINDANDAIRSRSKRLKARTDSTTVRGESAEDWAKWYHSQLQMYVKADDLAFQSVDTPLARLNCTGIGSTEQFMQNLSPSPNPAQAGLQYPEASALRALRRLLDSWDLSKSRAFLSGGGLQDPTKGSQVLGLTTFLEHSMRDTQQHSRQTPLQDDHELTACVDTINESSADGLDNLALGWLVQLLTSKDSTGYNSIYITHVWPDALKETIVQLLIQSDEFIYGILNELVESADHQLIQSIFELHLDIYGRITNPSSVVDDTTRTFQRDRLCRWASLASTIVHSVPERGDAIADPLTARFLWSMIVCNNLLEPTLREDTVACYRDLIKTFREVARGDVEPLTIGLVNNALMPEISIAAAEREIARLTTMDFFTSIFSSEDEHALTVIEKLEPFLVLTTGRNSQGDDPSTPEEESNAPDTFLQALRFLDQASVSLKLFLWQKLRDAYGVINYPPMILACNLRSMSLIVQHLSSDMYSGTVRQANAESYLQWLHKLDELLTQVVAVMLTDAKAFDCIDYDHLLSMLTTGASFLKILHVYAMWEDSIRVGQIIAPVQPTPTAARQQLKSAEKFRDMIVKAWTLQYLLLREATVQNRSVFDQPDEALLSYLKTVHYALGLKNYCSLANKMLLKLAKSEMLRMRPSAGWDSDLPQIIFDLHGLRISTSNEDIQDHSCEGTDIDRNTACELLDMVLLQVNRISMKEFLRSDLRFAVDKLQQKIKVPNILNAVVRSFNMKIVKRYLSSAINPIDLFRSLRGIGDLCCTASKPEGWELAEKGWYFLLGLIALSKFRFQKRTSAVSTEDLQNAIMYFKLDLEYGTEKWETWYRLGQVYDTLLDEQTTWSADKLENDQSSLVEFQRQAILCYIMAVANANRLEDPSFEDSAKIADLYKDFGIRLFASTREPFSMRVFALDEFERPYSSRMENMGMYQKQPFTPLNLYSAWKFASALLRKASLQKADDWTTLYALGKVLWKMHSSHDAVLGSAKRIPYRNVTNVFVQAVRCVPERKDIKHPDKDPILEPHYKLLSVTHKLIRQGVCSVQDGCRIVKASSYAQKVPEVEDPDEWLEFMFEVLKALRSADKSNWHHRMAYRAAMTIFETDPNDPRSWLGAKHELMQQIFTKTMTYQVWKPENERSGRHFVYTGRYVQFIMQLQFNLRDKEGIEALAKKVRKKSGDFINHAAIWQDLGNAYLSLLRHRVEEQIRFPTTDFEANTLLKMDPQGFQANAARIEAWINSSADQCRQLDIMRDCFEFKKLNLGLLDVKVIELLIADIYAVIYEQNAERLKYEEKEQENRVRMRMDNILSNETPEGSSANAPIDLNGNATPTTTTQEPAPPKRRVNIITHREVLRKAEALMTKPPPIATPKPAAKTLPAMAEANGKSPSIAVLVPPPDADKEIISVPDSPQSVHDSADDESELSEVDEDDDTISGGDEQPEENKQRPMFPNLANDENEGFGNGGGDEVERYAEELDRAGDASEGGREDSESPEMEFVIEEKGEGPGAGQAVGNNWGGEVNPEARKAAEPDIEMEVEGERADNMEM